MRDAGAVNVQEGGEGENDQKESPKERKKKSICSQQKSVSFPVRIPFCVTQIQNLVAVSPKSCVVVVVVVCAREALRTARDDGAERKG